MSLARLWTIVSLELAQRVRSIAWYVLLGVFAVILLGTTLLSFLAWAWSPEPGGAVYSTIVYIVLLLVLLVSPTFSGNALNGDRDAATLAPVQVTLATTLEIVLGKLLAAWITGLAFVVVAVPFIVVATATGGVQPTALGASLLVMVVEIGVFSAIGVGLSALIGRPLFSVAATYLLVALFVIGTPIVFALAGLSDRVEITSSSRYVQDSGVSCVDGPDCADADGEQPTYTCTEWETSTYDIPRFDRVWWVLAANPFVVLADATPTTYSSFGTPNDLFGQIASGVRLAQIPPETEQRYDGCDQSSGAPESPTTEELMAGTTPSWFVGLAVQLVVAALLVWGGWARTRTPARRLPPGTRIA